MSIITLGNSRADAMWAEDLPVLRLPAVELEDMDANDVVPETMEQLMQWAFVTRVYSRDPRRRFVLVYSQAPDDADTVERVCIGYQGYLETSEMRPLGNWTGNRSEAHSARQHLTIVGRGARNVMDAQTTRVNNIRELVHGSLKYEGYRPGLNGRLTFQHMVFTKVNPAEPQKSILLPSDDPTGKAAQMKDTWIVTKKVKTGQRLADGRVVPMGGLLFRPGDFVDVTATMDIVTTHTAGSKTLRVFLEMQSVVRLKQAKSKNERKADKVVPVNVVTRDTLVFSSGSGSNAEQG